MIQEKTDFSRKQHGTAGLNSELSDLRLRLFYGASIVFIVAPIIGEFSSYHLNDRINGSFTSSITMILATVLNYLWYQKSKNLELALKLTSFVQLLCYCWGLLASGGIYADHIVYMSLFPVINGFIFGTRGSILSVVFTVLFMTLMIFLEKLGVTEISLEPESTTLDRKSVV